MRAKFIFSRFGLCLVAGMLVLGSVQACTPQPAEDEMAAFYRKQEEILKQARADLDRARPGIDARNREAAERATPTGWEVSKGRSSFTDDRGVYLSTESQAYSGRYGDIRATLTVRCHEKTTSIILNWGEYLGDDTDGLDRQKRIRFRIDDAPLERATLGVSTDNEAVGWWSGSQAIPLARRLAKAQRLVVGITPYGESPREAEFNLAGLDQHLPELAAACDWKP